MKILESNLVIVLQHNFDSIFTEMQYSINRELTRHCTE
jgi:hypothetical protein